MPRRYQATGFVPIVAPPARVTRLADTDALVKGDPVIDDGSGYASNNFTAITTAFLGIVAAGVDNSGDDGLSVEIYPFDDKTQYIVPVKANEVIDRADVGLYVNLSENNNIALNITVTTGIAFFIEDIDISVAAIAANTYGYAIGRFRHVGVQAA